jgi:pimeloyl-ACP methyl ester carboxylesterase
MTGLSFARWIRPLVLATTLTAISGCGLIGDAPRVEPGGSSSSSPAPSVGAGSGTAAIHGTFDVRGNELFLDCTGTGTPIVVMVHGIIWDAAYGGGSADWTATRDELAARTCAYDRRNVGQSGQVPGRGTAADAVEDLHGLLRAAGVEPPYVLAGYSFGGLLTLLYAGTYPDEVAGIVLVDATLPLEWDLDPLETRPKVREELNDNDERIDFYGAGAMTAAALDSLPEVPITYLRATQPKDPKAWEEGAYEAALRKFMHGLPDGRLVEYDTDHGMLINIPADVADQIEQVLMPTST